MLRVIETLESPNGGIPFSRQLSVDLQGVPHELKHLLLRCVNLGLTLGSTGFATLNGDEHAVVALERHLSRVGSRIVISPNKASDAPGDS